ncbi:MAG: hypothetical protein ABIQ99_05170 [Thermoflexales bacterium]
MDGRIGRCWPPLSFDECPEPSANGGGRETRLAKCQALDRLDEIGRKSAMPGIRPRSTRQAGETVVTKSCRPPLHRADRDIRDPRGFGQGDAILDMGLQCLEPGHRRVAFCLRQRGKLVRKGIVLRTVGHGA